MRCERRRGRRHDHGRGRGRGGCGCGVRACAGERARGDRGDRGHARAGSRVRGDTLRARDRGPGRRRRVGDATRRVRTEPPPRWSGRPVSRHPACKTRCPQPVGS